MRIHIISELKGGRLYVNRDGDVGVCIFGSGYAGLPLLLRLKINQCNLC